MFLMLWLFFILLSGKWTWEIAIFGLLIAALVFAFACAFMDWSWRREMRLLRRLPYTVLYAATLFCEIVKANFVMLGRIYARKPVEPAIVTIRTRLKEDSQRVLLSNAITLTPGTITLHCEGDRLTVHCLDLRDADSLEGSNLEARIARLGEAK